MMEPARRDDGVPEPAPAPGDPPAAGYGSVVGAVEELRAALTMLTRLPVASASGERTGAAAYPIVGGLIGGLGLVPLAALGAAAPPIAAILAIAAIAVASGAVHLDGLADTADAMVALGPDGAERARKDPAIGVGGAASLVLVLGLEAASLSLLASDTSPLVAAVACVVAGGVSRGVPVLVARVVRQRAQPTGLGGWFTTRTTNAAAMAVVGSAVALCAGGAFAVGGPAVAVAGAVGGMGGVAIGIGLVRIRGQLDGDLLGASVELSFALTVVSAATLVGWTGA
jgi:adenosylcobinamide-GDP ribazoletransferase